MEKTIEVTGLTKVFKDSGKNDVRAVADVSFHCSRGEIFALLGPNGAGKTTTLRMIATVLKPTAGTASVAGHDLITDPAGVRGAIGFLSGNTGIYGRLTPREVLTYFGRLYSMSPDRIAARLEEVFSLLDMHDFRNRRCDKLSQGMKQKVSIARTIFHDPSVIIFDEPTTGLDVLTQRAIVDFIRHCRERDRCVVLSTHIMAEAEKLSDRIAVIHKGRILHEGTADEIKSRYDADLEDSFIKMIGDDA